MLLDFAFLYFVLVGCGLLLVIWVALTRDFVAEIRRRGLLRQFARFNLASMLTLMAAAGIALAIRPVFGLLVGAAVGLGFAWFVKLLLNEVLAGTKYGSKRSCLRGYRLRNQPLLAGERIEEPNRRRPSPSRRKRWWIKRPRGKVRLRLPRFDATNGWIHYKR